MKSKSRFISHIITRRSAKRLAVLAGILVIFSIWSYFWMIRMPGQSFSGPLPPISNAQIELSKALRNDVEVLAGEIGQRNVFYPSGLNAAVEFIDRSLIEIGYEVQRQTFDVNGTSCVNLEVEIHGNTKPNEIIVIGAHYDSVDTSPAANDNASGVAATLALARHFREAPSPSRTIRFVLFVNEEPPFFQTKYMGSLQYALRCKERSEHIVAMLSLETIGYYSDLNGSQHYPIAPLKFFYPNQGNFIAIVGNLGSRKLVREVIGSFRKHAQFPSEGAALPGWITGVGWSDQWAFWKAGYPAIMVTDTAPFRYPHYHSNYDTPDKLDYESTARVVDGIRQVVEDLANPPASE